MISNIYYSPAARFIQIAPVHRRQVDFIAYTHLPVFYNLVYGGIYCLYGTVEINATPNHIPVARKLRLYDQYTGKLVAEKWSDYNGQFVFNYLTNTKRYYVIAFDHTEAYNAVVIDNAVPERMS